MSFGKNRYTVVSEREDGIGRADPIKSHFYDYVRNEQKGGLNQADKFLPKRCTLTGIARADMILSTVEITLLHFQVQDV